MRYRGIGRAGSLMLAAVLLAACGSRIEPPPRPEPAPTFDPDLPADIADAIIRRTDFGLRSDVEYVEAVHAAADSVRHDLGLLVTPEEAADLDRRFEAQDDLGMLAAYGAEHFDTFGGMYIDQAAGGDVVLLFTRDVERHARAASALAPAGVAVRVRRVDFTEAELNEVLEGLDLASMNHAGLELVGAGVDIIRNVVTLEVKTNDPTFEQQMENAHLGRLDVTVHPVPGPWENAADGDGWRLLAFGETGSAEAHTVRAAPDSATWAEMWGALGLVGEPPAVDFETEVVVSFGHGIGGCPELRLDGVEVDDGTVFSVTSDPLAPRVCSQPLAGAAVFVVAVSRDALPDGGFSLRLSERSVTCEDCGSTMAIEVSLP